MSTELHLILQELAILSSAEWKPDHRVWTAARVAAGYGYCLEGGSARDLKTGDATIIGPGSAALFRASQLGELRLEYFTVEPHLLDGLFTVMEWHQLEQVASSNAQRVYFYGANEAPAQKFTRLAALSQRDALPARLAFLQLWASCLTSMLPAFSQPSASRKKLRHRFRQFFSQLSEKELAVSSLADMAAELNCSERHFSRMFREEFGVSLRDCQHELRMQRACRLLQDFKTKISSIALDCGYRHLGLFNIMFKKRFGLSPSLWRRQKLDAKSGDAAESARPAESRRPPGQPQIAKSHAPAPPPRAACQPPDNRLGDAGLAGP
jgi:AraC-like DNA-binding protein